METKREEPREDLTPVSRHHRHRVVETQAPRPLGYFPSSEEPPRKPRGTILLGGIGLLIVLVQYWFACPRSSVIVAPLLMGIAAVRMLRWAGDNEDFRNRQKRRDRGGR